MSVQPRSSCITSRKCSPISQYSLGVQSWLTKLSSKDIRVTENLWGQSSNESQRLILFVRPLVFLDFTRPSTCLFEVGHMPYTPPSQRSPAASNRQSPAISRSSSYVGPQHNGLSKPLTSAPRPGLPRSNSSTSYLNRERRSPSLQQNLTPDDTPAATPVMEETQEHKGISPTGSFRQSTPPINDRAVPTGAAISPPDSAQDSSDDDEPERGRARELENLRELKDAVGAIEMHRQGSPETDLDKNGKPRLALDLSMASPPSKALGLKLSPLSREARKISHSRSNTEPAVMDFARQSSESPSSESDVEEMGSKKPPMLRKKSGELVRPALRASSARRRPSSMPGTPTYSKAVHFDNNLEHVRHFLQVDRPLAVSATSSPADLHDGETEFPFHHDQGRFIEPPWQWEIRTPNFPHDSVDRAHMPVRVEKVFLSSDNKTLIGTVAVHNLAFHKSVVARFTLDFWKTTSEVSAEYSHDVRHKQVDDIHDRFAFGIKLEDQTNLEKKSLFFCVRYSVNGQEFWDSNSGMNYQVDFSKKAVPQRGKSGTPGNASKPLSSSQRSRPNLPLSSARPRPVSVPTFDDFAHGFDAPFALKSPPTAESLVGEKPIKFRNKSADTAAPDAPGLRTKNQGQAFGTRYDFGASLSATKQGLDSPPLSSPSPFPHSNASASLGESTQATQRSNAETGVQKPAALSEKPSLQSQSYNDLINKYCFVRSAKRTADGVEET